MVKYLYCYYSRSCRAWLYTRTHNDLSMVAFARRHGDLIKCFQTCRCLFKL